MQSPPLPRYLVTPRSKYSPQHHVLKHPQLPFLPQCQRPSFTQVKYTLHQIQSLRQILEETSEYAINIFNLFVDFKAACDAIRPDKLLETFRGYKITTKVNFFPPCGAAAQHGPWPPHS